MGPITAAQLLKGKLKQKLCIPGQGANGPIDACACGHEKKENHLCAYTNLAATIRKMQTTHNPQGALPNKKVGGKPPADADDTLDKENARMVKEMANMQRRFAAFEKAFESGEPLQSLPAEEEDQDEDGEDDAKQSEEPQIDRTKVQKQPRHLQAYVEGQPGIGCT